MMGVDECWPCNLRTNAGRMKFKNCINDGAGGIIKAENKSSKIQLVTQILFRFSRIVFPFNCVSLFPPFVTVVIISFLSSQNTRTKAHTDSGRSDLGAGSGAAHV